MAELVPAPAPMTPSGSVSQSTPTVSASVSTAGVASASAADTVYGGGGEKEQRHTAAAKHAQYRILLAWTVCVTWRESAQVAERVVLEGRGIAVGVASLQRARTCFSSTAKGLGRSTSFPTSSWFPICITN